MKRTVPWSRVLLEGFVIVGSILLAFLIDRSYDRLQARDEERVVLAGLQADFRANQQALETYVGRYEGIRAKALAAADLLRGGDEAIPSDSLARALAMFGGGSFDPRSSTLAQLESSGRAGLLRDTTLRTLLSEWQADRDDAADTQIGVDQWRDTEIWPRLADLGITPEGRGNLFEGALAFPESLSLDQARRAGLEGRLRIYAFLVAINRSDLIEVSDATTSILERIELLLGR